MAKSRVLFILKKRQSCWGDYNSSQSSGLFNSANFVNEMLQHNNIQSNIVEVVDNNCIHSSVKIETEDGKKTIKQIIDTKYAGKVKSLDENGDFVWSRVVNWFPMDRENTNKKFIKLITKPGNSLMVTREHKCAVIDDPLKPTVYFIEAEKSVGKYLVLNPYSDVRPLYNSDQLSVLIGSILGDGHLSKRNVFSCGHGIKQKEYLLFKHKLLGGFLSKTNNGEWGDTQYITTPVTAQTKSLRKLFYIDGVKQISEKVLDLIDEIGLAFWYMDDGCLVNCDYKNSRPHARLATHSFSEEENIRLQELFVKKWNLFPSISKQHQHGKTYFFLEFKKDDSEIFWKMIAKYVIPSMDYKIPKVFQSAIKYQFNHKPLEYGANEILDIKELPAYKQKSRLNDIEVEHTHNYIAGGVVVHNCIDRTVTEYRPTHVIIEALWVVPPKFEILHKLHPSVKWIIRNHSDFPFLSGEGSAMQFMLDYLQYSNVYISSNKESTNDYFKKLVQDVYNKDLSDRCLYLPNYYPLGAQYESLEPKNPKEVHVSCFGAIRPLKNHLNQAIAAIKFADDIDKKLVFHINATRIEGKGESILKSLESLFARTRQHKLEKHGWLSHEDFLKLNAKMDIAMQCSFSETFNIVAADAISQKIPIVVTEEISWASSVFSVAEPTTDAMVKALNRTYRWKFLNALFNELNLTSYSNKSEKIWVNYFK